MTIEQRLAEIEERLKGQQVESWQWPAMRRSDVLWLLSLVRSMHAVVEAAEEDHWVETIGWSGILHSPKECKVCAALQAYRRESEGK